VNSLFWCDKSAIFLFTFSYSLVFALIRRTFILSRCRPLHLRARVAALCSVARALCECLHVDNLFGGGGYRESSRISNSNIISSRIGMEFGFSRGAPDPRGSPVSRRSHLV